MENEDEIMLRALKKLSNQNFSGMEDLVTKMTLMKLTTFVAAFDQAAKNGTLEKYSAAVKLWYDQMRKAGFNDDQTIRIISHSFTRMLSNDG